MAKVSLRAYNREIETMVDRGQLDEAIAHCQHILKTFPKHLETYRLLGKAFLEAKRHKEAVDIFSRVLAVEPNDFVANVGISIVRDEENKLDDAIWHMERAFEVQPSNAAIQGELQRLYGRREGVQPPRIRMTRGALAQMYVQGELYPQALSEIKSVLSEDADRTDMQVLMARAYFRSGQKNEAADAASAVLRDYPYCLDANRILIEILGMDRPENSQLYLQRVIELDPYAAQVTGSIFKANEVGDAAVTLDRLEWSGQPAQSEWDNNRAISLDSGRSAQNPQAQPDWLKNGGFEDSAPLQPAPKVVPPIPASVPTFDFLASSPAPVSQAPVEVPPAEPTPQNDIPDFLREAGWGQSTGTFDESTLSFADEPEPLASASEAMPIAQGDMPDWLKAMAPPQATEPAAQSFDQAQPVEDEVLPDWINKIDTSVLANAATKTSTDDEFDWLGGDDQPAPTNQPDWMKGFGDESASTPALPADDQPDWMRQLTNQSAEPASASTMPTDFDFLNELTAPVTLQPSAPQPAANTADLGKSQSEIDDSLAWLENLAAKQGATEGLLVKPEDRMDKEPDWVSQAKSAPQVPAQPVVNVADLGKSQSEIDDSLAWLENLAAKQGATEGLLVKPEDRMDKEPDWVSQAKSAPQVPAQPPVAPQPAANVADLGKSQSEIDDSLAWLENLAAKQGATEGLLVKPEDRMDKEPDWVSQAKNAPQVPAQPPVAQQPAANVDDLGKSQSEIDDSLAWLENLAAKQGATEGLLVKPEDRMDKEPDWVSQAKNAPQVPAHPPAAQQPAANVADLGKSQSEIDDSLAWLENLAAKQGATEGLLIKPEDRMDKEPDWVSQVKNVPEQPVQQPVVSSQPPVTETPASQPAQALEPQSMSVDDTTAWLKSLDDPEPTSISIPPAASIDDIPAWMRGISEDKAPAAEPVIPQKEAAIADDVPSWLQDDEPKVSASLPQDDLPAWMRDETGEVVAEPTKIEPTRPTDWHPIEEKQPEPSAVQPVHEQPAPQPVSQVQEKPKPAPVKKAPPKPAESKPVPAPEPYREPVTRLRGTGMLTMPKPPVDPVLDAARTELSRSNIPGAIATYEKLIKKGRFLDEVTFDLREALYRYPVEVTIWQALGDAYMRANRLQDALDAYTKAEELLR